MKKMLKPEVEAVRFRGGIDVIATSAGGAPSFPDGEYFSSFFGPQLFNATDTYYTIEREAYQYNRTFGSAYYIISPIYDNAERLESVSLTPIYTTPAYLYMYAWFDTNGYWYTENKKFEDSHTEWDTGH